MKKYIVKSGNVVLKEGTLKQCIRKANDSDRETVISNRK